jgi:predicted component of type VI protein secretion system
MDRTLLRKMTFLLFIVAVTVLCVVAATESRNSTNLPLREAMIRVLGSANPNPSLGEEAQTFDRLVGSWDADFSFPQADGTVRHKKGSCISVG